MPAHVWSPRHVRSVSVAESLGLPLLCFGERTRWIAQQTRGVFPKRPEPVSIHPAAERPYQYTRFQHIRGGEPRRQYLGAGSDMAISVWASPMSSTITLPARRRSQQPLGVVHVHKTATRHLAGNAGCGSTGFGEALSRFRQGLPSPASDLDKKPVPESMRIDGHKSSVSL